MRFLFELIVIGALVWLTWEESLKDRIADVTGTRAPPAPPPAPIVRYVNRPTPTPSGQWMWDPSHKSPLDRPAYDSQKASQRYTDADGRKYWYDANGVRHYDPPQP